jgi:hypothetical protein
MRTLLPFALVLALLGAFRAGAEEFPPITAEEKALVSAPGEPNAPAVVLFRKGEFLMAGYGALIGSFSSHLKVQERRKILTEAGKGNGEIAVAHSDNVRLRNFSARTVLPDGRVIPVPANSRFERRTSQSRKTFVTSVAFPAVQPGAILDYQYEVVFASPFLLEPWFLSDEVPVRHAEIVYRTARGWNTVVWTREPLGVKIQQEKTESLSGTDLRAWADDLPAVPEVPYSPPFADLASQILVVPASYKDYSVKLLADWSSVLSLERNIQGDVAQHGLGVDGPARDIAGKGTPRQKAEALYKHVRDEIRTDGAGVLVDRETRLRKVFSDRSGTMPEKALLLGEMLKAAGIEYDIIWTADRDRGTVDYKVANPNWFDTALVAIRIDGQVFFLDPSDPSLGFGELRPGYEGAAALSLDSGQKFTLPEPTYDQNLRRAEIDLALDDKGRLAGAGTLRLTGPRAAGQLHGKEDPAKTAQAWTDWLAERWREYKISNVQVAEVPAERKVTVTWAMAQREEEALGDEATVTPSAPLGPASQPFVQAERKIDVVFDHPYRDEVELRLRWPEGWKLDRAPAAAKMEKFCGTLSVTPEPGSDGRSLVVLRRLDVTRRKIAPADYEAVRGLFAEAVKSDAQVVTLVRR